MYEEEKSKVGQACKLTAYRKKKWEEELPGLDYGM